MADKKLNQLNPASTLTVNDIIGICQNLATGEMVYESLGVFRQFFLGGANAGARIYFNAGAPSAPLGVDGDVTFDTSGKMIYAKEAGSWVSKDTYGSLDSTTGIIRFTSIYGSDGLAADGLSYQNDDLINATVLDVKVEVNPLIAVTNWGDTPGFDEYDFDDETGTVIFGSPVPAGYRITITASK